MNTKVKVVMFTIACVLSCFAIATPVAAAVAGLLYWIVPSISSFWVTFAYAVIGCGVFNVCAAWRSQKGYIKAYWESATVA